MVEVAVADAEEAAVVVETDNPEQSEVLLIEVGAVQLRSRLSR